MVAPFQSPGNAPNRASFRGLPEWPGLVLVVIILTAVFTAAAPRTASAQIGFDEKMGLSGSNDPIVALRNRMRAQQVQRVAIEGPVDASEYLVGPGDVFSLSLGGALPTTTSVAIGADGMLLIPDVGGVQVAGQTLSALRENVLALLAPAFRNVPVDISLDQPRLFFVHVTGSVPLPSRYLSSAVSRVDDAIQLSYTKRAYELELSRSGIAIDDKDALERGLPTPTSERPRMNDAYRPSLRNVRVDRRDGSTLNVDLLMYYATGDTRLNPYVRDGDVIVVPSYHEKRDAVTVAGELPFKGTYPHRAGDVLTDVLTLGQGSADLSPLGEVRIVRREGEGVASIVVNVQDILAGREEDPPIHAQDVVNVTAQEYDLAAIWGWVRGPGTYPIHGGVTTITELLQTAGGLRDEANLDKAYVDRSSPTLLKAPLVNSDLDFFGRTFYRSASSTTNRVAVDVAGIIRGEVDDFVLEHGDSVVFPKLENTVFVVGSVVNSGYVPFVEGKDAAYYLSKVGGVTDLTSQIYVMESPGGQIARGPGAIVPPGGTVFANRSPFGDTPELQSLLVTDRAAERQYRLSTTQTIISGVSAIAAIITTFVAISR